MPARPFLRDFPDVENAVASKWLADIRPCPDHGVIRRTPERVRTPPFMDHN